MAVIVRLPLAPHIVWGMSMHLRHAVLCLALLVSAAGCDGDPTGVTLMPPVALLGSPAIEARIDARVVVPIRMVAEGQVFLGLSVTNGLTETVSSGACADRVDARPFGVQTWRDVTPANVTCTLQLVAFQPGVPSTISVAADQAKLRAVAGGAAQTVFLRVRHVVSRHGVAFGVQSAEVPLTVP